MINIEENAIESMLAGVSACTRLIRPTYGGNGTNVVVETKLYPNHMVVNDAQSIIQAVSIRPEIFADYGMRRGVGFIKELCDKADKVSGDARKTTIILAEEILKAGYQSNVSKKQLKKDLDALIPFIESEIDAQTVKIGADQVKGVASTASESEEIGSLLQEIYQQIGANGILNIEGSKTYETSYKLTNGVRFEGTGMLSSEMVYDEEAVKEKRKETKAVYEKPLILVTKKKITTDEDINPLLKELEMSEKKDLVIFTNDMDSNVASMLVALHKSKRFNILIIKAPVLWQNYVFEDFAKCVGAEIVEDATGISFKNLSLKNLGTCEKIEVDSEDTVLTGIADITEHCKHLMEKGDDDSKLRLSWLAAKSAVLKLGANSESDLSYKRLKANDANRSTYLALQYGVVRGGGLCLNSIAEKLPLTEAGKILAHALQAPLKQAVENYGMEYIEYANIITDDIVDSAMVVKRAVRNAIGLASTILTAPSLVYIPVKTPEEMQYEIAMRQNNPFQ
jgi:chaperonin GroEL